MLTIEHNPTHIETALSEGREARGDDAGVRLDGITRKKNRKDSGLGVFARLLAGLVSKKTLKQGEGNPNGLAPSKSAEKGTKKEAFSGLNLGLIEGKRPPAELKGQFSGKNSISAARENKQKEIVMGQGSEDRHPLNPELLRVLPAEEKPAAPQTITFEPVSLKADFSGQARGIPERKIPYKKGETAENQVQGEILNATLQSKKEQKLPLNKTETGADTGTDAKKTGKKRNGFSLDVQDLRTQTGTETGIIAERGLKGTEELRNGSEREITVELRPSGERSEKPAEAGQKVTAGENFEQILARELQGDLSADIVRQAAIVLRDGGEGTIKLSLKPETLGKVKIHLEMAENRISGHIFVENEEALRAFEQEIHTLEQSFRDSGFEASLNAALDYRDGGQRWKEKEVEPFYSGRFAASYEESGAVEFSGGFNAGFGINAVNVLV